MKEWFLLIAYCIFVLITSIVVKLLWGDTASVTFFVIAIILPSILLPALYGCSERFRMWHKVNEAITQAKKDREDQEARSEARRFLSWKK